MLSMWLLLTDFDHCLREFYEKRFVSKIYLNDNKKKSCWETHDTNTMMQKNLRPSDQSQVCVSHATKHLTLCVYPQMVLIFSILLSQVSTTKNVIKCCIKYDTYASKSLNWSKLEFINDNIITIQTFIFYVLLKANIWIESLYRGSLALIVFGTIIFINVSISGICFYILVRALIL